MNPNSTHQLWSRWTAYVEVPYSVTHLQQTFHDEMKRATAMYFRRLFGSAAEMKIDMDAPRPGTTRFTIRCRAEGPPANDPAYRKIAMTALANFFGKNLRRYGKVSVRVDVFIEAGDPGNGHSPSQLIIAPPVGIH